MARKILLPRELEKKLYHMTNVQQEVNGILLYRRQQDLCPLERIFMTGVGDEGHVKSDPKRMEIANEFFSRNPEYQFVKFHTHSVGTIQKYGQYLAQHFSKGDIEVIKEQFQHDPEFIAMLVTPEKIILSGMDDPELRIVDDFPGYHQRKKYLSTAIKKIAADLEIDLDRFSATR